MFIINTCAVLFMYSVQCVINELQCMTCSLTQGQQWRAHSNNALSSCIIGQTVQGGQVAKGTSQLDATVEGNTTEG